MNKREYPLFLIDRSKAASYPFDFIACFDRTVGFVARVVFFQADEPYHEFLKQGGLILMAEHFNITMKLKQGGLILMAEDFLYNFEVNNETTGRIQTLLKKALKKYIHAEVQRTPTDDFGIESQINQQKLTIERAKQNYANLVARGGKESADYSIALAEATLETLEKYRDNQKLFMSWN